MDTARGIGIVLVVYAHALRGLYPTIAVRPGWASVQDSVIYAFHMPLFFMLAGLWIWPSMRRGRIEFVRNKIVAILYPYFLWSLIEGGIELAFARYANSPITLRDLLMIPLIPIEQFWFLYALFYAQLILMLCYPYRLLLPVAILAAIAAVSFIPFYHATIGEICMAVVYVASGSLAMSIFKALAGFSNAALVGISVAAWLVFGFAYGKGQIPLELAITLVRAIAGSVGTVAAAIVLSRGKFGALELLGRGSMAIYVMHTIATAASRTILLQSGLSITSPIILATTSVVGIVTPLAAWWLAARFRITRVLGLPDLTHSRG